MVLTEAREIKRFHMLAQYHAMVLESKGLFHKGGSVTAFVKRTYGLKGKRESVIQQFRALIDNL